MTERTSETRERINLRPTLIVGLGGSGYRITVELKARLEELGRDSGYDRVVKFLCFDTANENFTARQPNHPEQAPVALARDREFVRISDVPLHDLMRSKETNPAIAAIFPEILHSTQIDQGAQQIRRLGRIALFYHYRRVKEKINQTIKAVRQMDVMGHLGTTADGRPLYVADRNRLRVYILCSLCGGTGSGIFIDMAYLIRHIGVSAGLPSARAVDVVGVLLLPEAFPEIVTTGADRIQANTYASLLDLEYYNQASGAEEMLYRIDLPGEHVEVVGMPFSQCYLVGGSGPTGTVRGMVDLAPVLADTLALLISSRVGEQLDATLDNIRASLTLYLGGFRAFYSALGMAQVVYPDDWMRRQFAAQLKARLVREYILREPPGTDIQRALVEWQTRQENTIQQHLSANLDTAAVTRRLQALLDELDIHTDVVSDLQDAFRDGLRLFQQNVVGQLQENIAAAGEALRGLLRRAVSDSIDAGLTQGKGLAWTLHWLNRVEEALRSEARQEVGVLDHNTFLNQQLTAIYAASGTPVVGRWWIRQRVVPTVGQELINYLRDTALSNAFESARRTITLNLLEEIETQRRRISRALSFWRGQSQVAAEEDSGLQYTIVTASVFKDDAARQAYLQRAIDEVYTAWKNDIAKDLEAALNPLSASLEPAEQGILARRVLELCEAYYGHVTLQSNVIKHVQPDSSEQGREMIRAMGARAEPLLVYSRGLLQAAPPREIKVIGANTVAEGERFIRPYLGDAADISIVETYEPSRVSYVVSHHGIPMSALNKLDDYRAHYEKLQAERNAIFHLDNQRESEPYDPGSYYFINLEDFHAYLGRALAYGCIQAVEKASTLRQDPLPGVRWVFVLSQDFYHILGGLVDVQLKEMQNEIEKLRAVVGDEEDVQTHEQVMARRRMDILERNCRGLRDQMDLFRPLADLAGFVPALRDVQPHALWMLAVPTGEGAPPLPATTLELARDAIFSGETRLMPHLFLQAIQRYYVDYLLPTGTDASRDKTDQSLIDRFLQARRYVPHNHDEAVAGVAMLWSERGQPSYALEERLCALLTVYGRFVQKRIWSARAGYFGGRSDEDEGS